jgi:hypothetical protein
MDAFGNQPGRDGVPQAPTRFYLRDPELLRDKSLRGSLPRLSQCGQQLKPIAAGQQYIPLLSALGVAVPSGYGGR